MMMMMMMITPLHLLTQTDTHRPPSIFIDPTVDSVLLLSCGLSVFSSSGSSCKLYTSLSTSMHSPSKLGFSNTKAYIREGEEGVKDETWLQTQALNLCVCVCNAVYNLS